MNTDKRKTPLLAWIIAIGLVIALGFMLLQDVKSTNEAYRYAPTIAAVNAKRQEVYDAIATRDAIIEYVNGVSDRAKSFGK